MAIITPRIQSYGAIHFQYPFRPNIYAFSPVCRNIETIILSIYLLTLNIPSFILKTL